MSKLGHVTQATPIQESFYIPYAGGGPSSTSVPNLKRISIRSKVIKGVPKLGN